jgi:hypothetical protein
VRPVVAAEVRGDVRVGRRFRFSAPPSDDDVRSGEATIHRGRRAPTEQRLRKTAHRSGIEADVPLIKAHIDLRHSNGYKCLLEDYALDAISCGDNIEAMVLVEGNAMGRKGHLTY